MAAHEHAHDMAGSRLRTALGLTAVILLVELTGGLLSHSLALLSDAGHVFTDIVALGLAWYATVQAQKPADAKNTYGYHRIGILTALANAVTLILIVGAITYEAVQRLQHPGAVTPWVMFASAAVGIVVNLYIGFGLRSEGSENLNIRAAMLHVFGDVGASSAVVIGGVVILLTRWYPADPLISLAIACPRYALPCVAQAADRCPDRQRGPPSGCCLLRHLRLHGSNAPAWALSHVDLRLVVGGQHCSGGAPGLHRPGSTGGTGGSASGTGRMLLRKRALQHVIGTSAGITISATGLASLTAVASQPCVSLLLGLVRATVSFLSASGTDDVSEPASHGNTPGRRSRPQRIALTGIDVSGRMSI